MSLKSNSIWKVIRNFVEKYHHTTLLTLIDEFEPLYNKSSNKQQLFDSIAQKTQLHFFKLPSKEKTEHYIPTSPSNAAEDDLILSAQKNGFLVTVKKSVINKNILSISDFLDIQSEYLLLPTILLYFFTPLLTYFPQFNPYTLMLSTQIVIGIFLLYRFTLLIDQVQIETHNKMERSSFREYFTLSTPNFSAFKINTIKFVSVPQIILHIIANLTVVYLFPHTIFRNPIAGMIFIIIIFAIFHFGTLSLRLGII